MFLGKPRGVSVETERFVLPEGQYHPHHRPSPAGRSEKPILFLTSPYGGFHGHGGTPIAGWFLLGKIPLKMDDLGVPPFMETPLC